MLLVDSFSNANYKFYHSKIMFTEFTKACKINPKGPTESERTSNLQNEKNQPDSQIDRLEDVVNSVSSAFVSEESMKDDDTHSSASRPIEDAQESSESNSSRASFKSASKETSKFRSITTLREGVN